MSYSTELPEDFDSWVEFYQTLRRAGLDSQTTVAHQVQKKITVINPHAGVTTTRYEVAHIKEQAFAELIQAKDKAPAAFDSTQLALLYRAVKELMARSGLSGSSGNDYQYDELLDKLNKMLYDAHRAMMRGN